jgi:hypothetical protein
MRQPLVGSTQAVAALADRPALAHRVLPVTWWSYPTLAATALLGGLLIATYVRGPDQPAATRATSGGLLSFLAIGCPVCNKVVVLAFGTTGAVSLWAPLQPVLAVASISLLGWGLATRLANERACTVPVTSQRSSSHATKG